MTAQSYKNRPSSTNVRTASVLLSQGRWQKNFQGGATEKKTEIAKKTEK